jgi:homoserine kinase
MNSDIKVFAPATVANVGSAFDVLGFAVEAPGDELILRKNNSNKLVIKEITGDGDKLSLDPESNTCSVSIQELLNKLDSKQGFDIHLHKKMPLGSGLGSSAASTVAGVYAANLLLGSPLATIDLLPFAMEGERLACGAAHADNVGPCLIGGFVLISSYNPLIIRKIPFPNQLNAIVVHPKIEVGTRDAREVLRQKVSLKQAAEQWGRVGGLIAGLYSSDYELIGSSLQDIIVEPVRSVLIPGFYAVKQAAMENGALGCSISGSGPSVFALCGPKADPEKIGRAMGLAFETLQIDSSIYISIVNEKGPLVIA